MALKKRIATNPTHFLVFIFWIIVLIGDTLGQEVTFRPQDEVNDAIIFEQERNVKLVCDVRGFPDDAVIQIRHESFGLISGQGSASTSGNFTIEEMAESTILTIKEVSDLTDGQYTCTVVVSNRDPVSALFDLVMIPRFGSPQCYNPTIAMGGSHVTEGDAFHADCFYEDLGESAAKWVKIGSDGAESIVSSDEIMLDGKFRRRLVIQEISEAENGVTYKCRLDITLGAIMVPTKDCAVGPLEVSAVTSTVARRTTLASSAAPHTEVSAITSTVARRTTLASSAVPHTEGQSTPVSQVTTGQGDEIPDKIPNDGAGNEPFSLENYLLFIIIGAVAVTVILFVLLGICICCFSRRSGGRTSKDLERGKDFSQEVNGNPIPDYDQMPFDSKQRNGSPYYDKPPPSTGVHNPGYANLNEAEARTSVVIPGPEDMISTHL